MTDLCKHGIETSTVCFDCDQEPKQYKTAGESMTDLEKLRAFAQFVLEDWPEGEPDEFELQDKAIEYGLLEGHMATEPCGENCWCESYDGKFPLTCYRKSKLLTGEI